MALNDFVRLGPAEIVPDHPFTDPQHSRTDLITLGYMFARLMEVTHADLHHCTIERCQAIYADETDGRRHRLIIKDRRALLASDELAVVGFCGQRRSELATRLLHEMESVDRELIEEMTAQPYLLSYSSMELADSNWTNLVLMRSKEGIEHWRASRRHAAAVSDLSPHYYRSIRLHNAVLTIGLHSPRLTLLRTKYYDYGDGRCWMAIREFPLSPDSHPGLLM